MKILRTMGILALVAGLVLGGGGSALAQEEEPELAEIEGVIKAIDIDTDDTEAGTVTIAPEKGKAVILTITGDTEINKDDEEPATINDLAKDDEVEALYNPETLEAVEIVAKSPEPAENGGPAGEPRAGGSPKRGPHSPKHGLSGNVTSVTTITGGYVIRLETMDWGIVDITANVTATYMAPTKTKGPVELDEFVAVGLSGSITAIEGRRLALLVTPLTADTPPPDYTATAIRLMLIPSPGTPPSHAHRVGVVEVGAFDPDSSITIIDKDGVSHTFTVGVDTVYRPSAEDEGISELTGDDLIEAIEEGCVTVVTKGGAGAKAIVLHDELPDWAP